MFSNIVAIVKLIQSGIDIYNRWVKGKPYREFQEKMNELSEELEREDDELTNKRLREII